MYIRKNKVFYYNLLLLLILFMIGYRIFFSNKVEMQGRAKLTNKEIREYTLLAKEGNQSAIKYLFVHYAIYKKDKEMSCFWSSKGEDKYYYKKYCESYK